MTNPHIEGRQPSPESGRELAKQHLEAFAENEGLDELAGLFGVTLPEDTTSRLEAMWEIAEEGWDFRKGGKERQEVEADELLDVRGSDQWNAVFKAGYKLGLVQSTYPYNTNPDFLTIWGGANNAPRDRLRYGLQNIEDFGTLIYLGSSRSLNAKLGEPEKVEHYAPNAQTEFDLGCAAFETLLENCRIVEKDEPEGDDTLGWRRQYEFEYNGVKHTGWVLKSPFDITDPNPKNQNKTRRANTYDNAQYFAGLADLAHNHGTSMVAVTGAHFTSSQHLPAVQELTLPYGVHLETIGHDAAYNEMNRLPSQLLQETKTAIGRARRLQAAIEQS